MEDENKESLTTFPVNPNPRACKKVIKGWKAIHEASHATSYKESGTMSSEDTQFCGVLTALQAEIQVRNKLSLYKIKLKQAKELVRIQPTVENKCNYYHLLSNPPLGISNEAELKY
jgi:hypothetical protein